MNYLFVRILEIISIRDSAGPRAANKMAHETLALACHEGLSGSGQAYGNLFSQVDFLCRKHNVKLSDRIAIQAMRRHSNSSDVVERGDFMYDMKALARFVSAVTGCGVPHELLRLLPMDDRTGMRAEGLDVRYVRCIVVAWDDDYVYVTAEQGLSVPLLAVDVQAEHLVHVRKMLREGLQMNLLDCKMSRMEPAGGMSVEGVGAVVVPGIVVVEPDYLLDISSLAACFKDYGHHPLTYFLSQMRRRDVSQPILLGNLASAVLDGIINQGDAFDLAAAVRSNFAGHALEYCSCDGFDAAGFMQAAREQAANIRQAVSVMFADHDRRLAVLEPSFVCEALGLQGRVDLMTTDMRLLVEQKSGKNYNIASGRPGTHGSRQLEPHYVQLLLYAGVLRYNFRLGFDRTDMRLLYSKYKPEDGLLAVAFYRQLFREAVELRNKIVATDFMIAREGFGKVLPLLMPDTVNTAKRHDTYYERWLLPELEAVTNPLKNLQPLEREYFCAMMTFAARERIIGKTGSREGISSCAADLWNMPLAEKIETGNIYTGLRITTRRPADGGDAAGVLTLSVPQQGDTFLPNFRRGDMVYLYSYREGEEPDVRRSILYKACVTELHTTEITLALVNPQGNPAILPVQGDGDGLFYAVEHADGGASAGSSARALHEFVTAPPARKDLLLARRAPEKDASADLSRPYNEAYDDVLLRVRQANDYFLLVGPPGTGKTSMAIRFIVEEELTRPGASVLLTAYTNRAVDELCAMLDDAGIDYIRISSEYSASSQSKSHLLSETVKTCHDLRSMRERIMSVPVITGTTSMLAARPYIFDLKAFTLAVVDEASQILEPDIVGLLATHRPGGDGKEVCRIRKFVLTGDHKQLPAVVQQDETLSAVACESLSGICLDNCRGSLFERLLRVEHKAGRTEFVGVLRRHGRMHPEVADFPCREFYSKEMLSPVPLPHQQETALQYADIGMADGLDTLLRGHRVVFIPSRLCRRPDVSDKVNTDEAAVVAEVLRRVRLMTGDGFDASRTVGVIVPYRNQIAVIRKEIEKLGMKELEDVSIDTVERYQGSQRDVIIYSFTVQSEWQLEFLAGSCFDDDGRTIDRKLNVALTRARRQMIMTGNVDVLSKNAVFRELIDYVKGKGGMA